MGACVYNQSPSTPTSRLSDFLPVRINERAASMKQQQLKAGGSRRRCKMDEGRGKQPRASSCFLNLRLSRNVPSVRVQLAPVAAVTDFCRACQLAGTVTHQPRTRRCKVSTGFAFTLPLVPGGLSGV